MSGYRRIYVVAYPSNIGKVSVLIDSLRKHPFLEGLEIRTVTFDDFEETDYCKKSNQDPQAVEMLGLYRDAKATAAAALIERDSLDAAVIIPESHTEERAIIHEFGHIRAAKTPSGLKLRKAYESKRLSIKSIIKEPWPYTRSLIERAVLFPEECEIEHQILESLPNKNERERYLEHDYNIFQNGLVEAELAEKSGDPSKRIQAGLHRFNFALVCRWFGETAREFELGGLGQRFQELSSDFAKTADLSDIRFDQLWNLVKEGSLKVWVHQSMNAMRQIARKRSPQSVNSRRVRERPPS